MYKGVDAHITLFYANQQLEPVWQRVVERIEETLETLKNAARRQRGGKSPFYLSMIYSGFNEPGAIHYAWCDILVDSRLHSSLHQLCHAAFKVAEQHLGGRWRWAFGKKNAFHLSFRTRPQVAHAMGSCAPAYPGEGPTGPPGHPWTPGLRPGGNN